MSFAALVGRADSAEEVTIGKTVDWIIFGPLWASVIFLCLNASAFGRRKGHGFAFKIALATWIAVALVSNWWEDEKVRMRQPGNGTICLSNLKQLGLAIAMYSDLNQGRCPMDSTNPTLVGSMQLLSNVSPLVSAKMLYCPSDHRPGARAEPDFRKLTPLNISYSYVPNLLWQSTPDSALALDRIYRTSAGSSWSTAGNHIGQGGNILFNDGHVAWANTLPIALKDKNGKEIVLSP